MPYCRKCGTKIEEDARFCPKCGTSVGLRAAREKERVDWWW